jgi:hypothetical protein
MERVNENSLSTFIKNHYKKIIFNPLKFEKINVTQKSIGFIISDNKVVVGYINKDGNLCKLMEPVDLSGINFKELIKKIPVVNGFDSNDKEKLLLLLENSPNVDVSKDELIEELKQQESKKYNVNFDPESKELMLIKKEYTDQLSSIQNQYLAQLKEINETDLQCKQRLIYEKTSIIDSIKDFRKGISEYIESIVKAKDTDYSNLNEMYKKLNNEKADIEMNMNKILEREKSRNPDKEELEHLRETVKEITDELSKLKNQISETEIKNKIEISGKEICIKTLLQDKETIINEIKNYNKEWLKWVETQDFTVNDMKNKLKDELSTIFETIKRVVKYKDDYLDNLNLTLKEKENLGTVLKSNVSDIKNEITNSISLQILELSKKNKDLEMSVKQDNNLLVDKENTINDLKMQLLKVRQLLEKNNTTNIKSNENIDINACSNLLHKFININNIFYRKKEIINILDSVIISEGSPKHESFTNLTESMRNNIKQRYCGELCKSSDPDNNSFGGIRGNINKHIEFMNLKKYMDDHENIEKLKNNKPDPVFCQELTNISSYWDSNSSIFKDQDTILTNIYEDLIGAVRVYIKIKPVIPAVVSNTVFVEADTKNISVDCSLVQGVNKKQTFSNFYGVFDESFSNKEMYTGIKSKNESGSLKVNIDNIIEKSNTTSPGMYNVFKQVEDGYSVVIFGYGSSGSGKTFTLLGNESVPGLLHYGLTNLRNVQNIKLKYIFEQYISKFNPTLNKMSGTIINLNNEVPQMRNYSTNEEKEFSSFLNGRVNLNNIRLEDITLITGLLETYRLSKDRIKKTPNNPVSSRSHMYLVFEITFTNGKIGYITICDTAGRESPLDIYNIFIDQSKRTSLTTILGPTGGPGAINLKSDLLTGYDKTSVFNILKEGFYINETINHLVYFLNKKNYRKTKVIGQKGDPSHPDPLSNYQTSRFYVNPVKEEERIDPVNNCLMIPILKFLDALSNKKSTETEDYRPTKFCMIVCIRKEEVYCNQIFDSLEFAQAVKSS